MRDDEVNWTNAIIKTHAKIVRGETKMTKEVALLGFVSIEGCGVDKFLVTLTPTMALQKIQSALN